MKFFIKDNLKYSSIFVWIWGALIYLSTVEGWDTSLFNSNLYILSIIALLGLGLKISYKCGALLDAEVEYITGVDEDDPEIYYSPNYRDSFLNGAMYYGGFFMFVSFLIFIAFYDSSGESTYEFFGVSGVSLVIWLIMKFKKKGSTHKTFNLSSDEDETSISEKENEFFTSYLNKNFDGVKLTENRIRFGVGSLKWFYLAFLLISTALLLVFSLKLYAEVSGGNIICVVLFGVATVSIGKLFITSLIKRNFIFEINKELKVVNYPKEELAVDNKAINFKKISKVLFVAKSEYVEITRGQPEKEDRFFYQVVLILTNNKRQVIYEDSGYLNPNFKAKKFVYILAQYVSIFLGKKMVLSDLE